jgi:hypothetical protein
MSADSTESNDEHDTPDPGCQALDEIPHPNSLPEQVPPQVDRDIDLEELSDLAQLGQLKSSLEFIRALESASLDDPDVGLDPESLERLRNPPQEPVDVSNPDLHLSIDLFLAVSNSSEETYTSVREAVLRRFPDVELLSLDQVKRRVAELSGVVPIVSHMCINTCLAFVGPFAQYDACPTCGESRYDLVQLAASNGKKKVPRQVFHSIPIGLQLQALWRDAESARSLRYRNDRTKEILEELARNQGLLDSYDDFLHGSDYLQAVTDGRIKADDTVLMFSIDGAQLYRNKASDCWISIWVLFDRAPSVRYKKMCVMPDTFIPGPNKPKHLDSFLFPSLHHLIGIQKEGLRIWDASRNLVVTSHPFLALGTADGPGMACLNGLVGHHGRNGCRLYCSVTGRHKPGGSHYYPAHLKPHNYRVKGSDHDDVDASMISSSSFEKYQENLRKLISSTNDARYKACRLETGISKPSIFLALPIYRSLGVPRCFSLDMMHLVSLNVPELLVLLWRGTLECDKTDNVRTWDWAVLQDDTWKTHGKAVAASTPYLPGSFDRPPRNPAEKISSGYKAWEYLMYIFGLGPGLFHNVLPEKYWKNLCKLVFGIRIVHQYKIITEDLRQAHIVLNEFCDEFELLYYQRRIDRLHMIRPCIHLLRHIASEVLRVGPLACSSQWTLERTIGNLGEEIRQPSNPFANLSQRGIRRAQVNALKAMIPSLEPPTNSLPSGAVDIGDGYVLLRAMEKWPSLVRECEAVVFRTYLRETEGTTMSDEWHPSISRWARVRLPNGQVARSAWKERLKPLNKLRKARIVKVCHFHGPWISYKLICCSSFCPAS